jgi:hypothetical protein
MSNTARNYVLALGQQQTWAAALFTPPIGSLRHADAMLQRALCPSIGMC